jgi:hypothetical protein
LGESVSGECKLQASGCVGKWSRALCFSKSIFQWVKRRLLPIATPAFSRPSCSKGSGMRHKVVLSTNSYVDQAGKILLGEYGRQLGSLSNHRGNNADVLRVVSVCFVRPLTYLSRRNHRSFGRAKPTSANRSFGAQSNEYL